MNHPNKKTGFSGTEISGDVNTGTFIGRDQIIVLTGYTSEQLDQTLERLVPLLRQPDIKLQIQSDKDQTILALTGGEVQTRLSLDAARAISTRASDEATYLTALLINPNLRRWATQFVPLAGTLTIIDDPGGVLDLHPEFSVLHSEGHGAARRVFRERLPDITKVLDRYDTFVILGDPGAGKTTVLRKLALEEAQRRLRTGEGRLPFLVTLADYRGEVDPYTFLSEQVRQRIGETVSIRELLAKGELLLLCDSLNEIPRSNILEYRIKVRKWRNFINEWPGNQIIFACRGRDYSEPIGLQQVEIELLDRKRVRQFLDHYLNKQHANTLWEQITSTKENLIGLARNPYLLTMMMTIFESEGSLPANRAYLFTSFINVLITRESGKGHPEWLPESALIASLSRLAWNMLEKGEGTRLSYTEFQELLPKDVQTSFGKVSTPPEMVLRLGLASSLLELVLGTEEEEVHFYHHLLQESMAAREMLRRWQTGEKLEKQFYMPRRNSEMLPPGKLRVTEPLPPPPTSGWEETTILAAGLASNPSSFIDAVQKTNPVLAARCLVEGGIQTKDILRTQIQKTLLEEIRNKNIHLRTRIVSGEVLGHLGDPRFENLLVEGKNVLIQPMIDIPASQTLIGSPVWVVWWLLRNNFKYAHDERPRHKVKLPSYQICRFPVTNMEFTCFIEDDGYKRSSYWTNAGRAWLNGDDPGGGPEAEFLNLRRHLSADPSTLARWKNDPDASSALAGWRALITESDEKAIAELREYYSNRSRTQPAFWEDERYYHSNHPVVGVTWYEAMAYCSWLNEKLRLARRLPKNHIVRIPTEVEWENSAKGSGFRTYPWGWKWDSSKANTREGHVLRPTPVGVYPNTNFPHDCLDMAGNVWEWTHSLHRPYPYKVEDGREDVDDQNYRALRGSSWIDPHGYARCSYRGRHPPDFFDYDFGFRYVIGPQI